MTPTVTERTFLLPDLGEGLTEAAVVQWLVAPGEEVAVDQAVAEVETAKSVVEVPSPYAGRVGVLHAAEGETVEVGRPLITIVADDDAVAGSGGSAGGGADGAAVLGASPGVVEGPALVPEGASVPAPEAGAAGVREGEAYREEERAGSGNVLIGYGTSASAGPGRRRRSRGAVPSDAGRPVKVISPIVRRLAREAGLDLAAVRPTGAGGVVTRSDVRAAVAARDVPGSSGERRIPLTGFQKAASAVLTRSRAEIPEATVWVDVDATALWDLREATRRPGDDGPGLLAHLARFVVAGLREYPVLNGRLDVERGEIVVPGTVNLGIAVQGELGLVAPAVLGADTMTTAGLDAAVRDVVARARAGRSTAEELSAGTFTLNNYGSLGVDGSAAIINHPQVAMLGFGRIIDRPWVVDGAVVPRKITQMSFVFDHRVCDGATAAAFMRSVADAVEDPLAAIVRQ